MQIKIVELTGIQNADEAMLNELAATHRLVSVMWDSYKAKALAYLEKREDSELYKMGVSHGMSQVAKPAAPIQGNNKKR